MIRRWVNKEILEIAHRSQEVSPALFAEKGKVGTQEVVISTVDDWENKERDVAKEAIKVVLQSLTNDGILVESESSDHFLECVDCYLDYYKNKRSQESEKNQTSSKP